MSERIPSVIHSEFHDQIREQENWGKEEYTKSIYEFRYGENSVVVFPFERIEEKSELQLKVFSEILLSEHKCKLVVMSYAPSTQEGLVTTRAKHQIPFESFCRESHISVADFDLVRNNLGNLIYQGIGWVPKALELKFFYSFNHSEKLTRKQFLKYSLLFVLGSINLLGIYSNILQMNKSQTQALYFHSNLLRRANIAENIIRYLEGKSNEKIAIFYPPVHAAWIRFFLEHPNIRRGYYNIGIKIFPESAKNPIINEY